MGRRRSVFLALLLLAVAGCRHRSRTATTSPNGHAVVGLASWYGPGFAGKATASGEIFDPDDLTAAHKTLPFDSRVLVRRQDTGATVWVRINDRGPFVDGRIIDLSYAAAQAIDMIGPGTAPVALTIADAPEDLAQAWFVQVGAFSREEGASETRRELERDGHAVVIAGDGPFRVRVGPFPDRARAESAATRLRQEGRESFVLSALDRAP